MNATMDAKKVLIFGIIFIVMGFLFLAFGFMARAAGKDGKKDSRSSFSKIAGNIYMVLGAITFALGLTTIIIRNDVPWFTIQVFAVFYLMIVAIISLVFSMLVKTRNEFNMKNSYTKSSEEKTDDSSSTI